MEMALAGRGAIVTGAASGIGKATLIALNRSGARVVGVDRDAIEISDVHSVGREGWTAIAADLSDPAQVEAAMKEAMRRLGHVAILVNVAGVGYRAGLVETTDAQYDAMFNINVRAVFLSCRLLIPHMLEHGGGAIVNVASSLAAKAAPDRAIYAATKAAVVALTRSIAIDYGAQGIRANCVSPGTTDTPWIDRILAGASNPSELRSRMEARQAIGRLGRPEEIAEAIRFLVSDDASFVHGAALAVDGGQTAW